MTLTCGDVSGSADIAHAAVVDYDMRWAFKVAYVGEGFHGSQRQPELRTVEGELLDALRSLGAIQNAKDSRFQMAGRTDVGVSALGNVAAFNSFHDPRSVIPGVNAGLSDLWLYAYAAVPDNFNPRRALERWYRYHFPRDMDIGRLARAARQYEGVHDFGPLSRGRSGGVCNIRSIECHELGQWIVLDVRANRFLWNMVRRIASSLQMYASCSLSLDELTRIRSGRGAKLQPAPPDFLVLMDVIYDLTFTPFRGAQLAESVVTEGALRGLQATLLAELGRRLISPPGDLDPGNRRRR